MKLLELIDEIKVEVETLINNQEKAEIALSKILSVLQKVNTTPEEPPVKK